MLKESKSVNHIIFLDYLNSRKIVVLDFQYTNNFLLIRFFVIGLKIDTDLNKNII